MNCRTGLITALFILLALSGYNQCENSFLQNSLYPIRQIAVSENGVMLALSGVSPLLRSEDEGKSWSKVDIGNYGPYLNVFFTSGSIGYLLSSKALLKTEDAGRTWFPLVVPPTAPLDIWNNLSKAYFMDDNRGFLANQSSYSLYFTKDGGRSFKETSFDKDSATGEYIDYHSAHFADTLNGVLFSSRKHYLITMDGGEHWQPKEINLPEDILVSDMKMVSPDTLIAALRNGKIIRTINGGASWSVLHTLNSGSTYYQITILNKLKLFICAERYVYKTGNTGDSWDTFENLPDERFLGLSLSADKSKLLLFGGGQFGNSYSQLMMASSNEGVSWDTLSYILPGASAMHFPDAKNGYVAAALDGLFKTANGGITWKRMNGNIPNDAALNYYPARKIQFLSPSIAYVFTNRLYASRDSGKTWVAARKPAGFDTDNFIKFQFLHDSLGFLADNMGLYRTRNKGQAWTKVFSITDGGISDFQIHPSSGVGLMVGYNGEVKRTQDFGATWQSVNFGYEDLLASAFVVNGSLAFIGTHGNRLLRSTDGGVTWQSRILDNYYTLPLKHFLFAGSDSGIVVSGAPNAGSSRTFLTTDSGNSWVNITDQSAIITGVGGTLGDIKYLNQGNGIIFKEKPMKLGKVGYINGKLKTCVGQKDVYKIFPVFGATGYVWNATGNPVNKASGFTDTLTWLTPGIYQISVTAYDDCGFTDPQTFEVEVVSFEPLLEKISDTVLMASGG